LRYVERFEYPVGTAEEISEMILDFENIARILLGLKKLKIISFGPRPQDFLACNAPIKPLYDLGIEIMENSELDLFEAFTHHENDSRISEVMKNMEKELGDGNRYSGILPKLAQYELTLEDWMLSDSIWFCTLLCEFKICYERNTHIL